jgi:hypothetical protein
MILERGKLNIGPIDSMSWGSGGKGKFADYLAVKENVDFAIAHNSQNASHITQFDDGSTYKFNALPSSVSNENTKVVIGADAAINMHQLLKEIKDWNLTPNRLFIHPNVAIITQEQIAWEEENLGAIGSTMSGVGAAKGFKIMRHAGAVAAEDMAELKPYISNVHRKVIEWLQQGQTGLLETAQGFDLSMDVIFDDQSSTTGVGKFWPACTSRNINPTAFAGMSFIPHKLIGSVLMNLRTYAIRVGDSSTAKGSIILKFDDGSENSYCETDLLQTEADGTITAEEFRKKANEYKGKTVEGKTFRCIIRLGSSGKCYPDQVETDWQMISNKIGLNVKESTSLTKRTRRVFNKSRQQLQTATMSCMPTHLFINFMNYIDPSIAGVSGSLSLDELKTSFPKAFDFISWVDNNQYWQNEHRAKVALLGTGPKRSEIIVVV